MSSSKTILVTGATGNQGGATIDALLTSPSSPPFTILAVTRNPTSASATTLQQKSPTIKIIQGDLKNVPALFTNVLSSGVSQIHGVFSIQAFAGQGQSVETEEQQGKALVDEALKHNVKHFVYSSVDRGGESSLSNPTEIPHFRSKHNIEKYLIEKTKGTDMQYTILRPTAFMENWQAGFLGKGFGAMWVSALKPERKLQLISVKDIGHFAAEAFRNPQKYQGRAISLAGDDLTFAQANQIWKEKMGYPAPATYAFLGAGLMWGVKELGTMFRWFQTDGYGADIPSLKKEHPGLLSLGDWVEKHSAFAKK